MKQPLLLLSALITMCVTSCSTDNITTEELNANTSEDIKSSNERRIIINRTQKTPCLQTDLIAGQHHIAGEVNIYKDNDSYVLAYITNNEWTIKATHLSIGTFGEHQFPQTKSGNPKVGKFEHKSNHQDGVTYVEYIFDDNDFDDLYWFAAHAVVIGPNGEETAWADGSPFGEEIPIGSDERRRKKKGNWAMVVVGDKISCKVR